LWSTKRRNRQGTIGCDDGYYAASGDDDGGGGDAQMIDGKEDDNLNRLERATEDSLCRPVLPP